MREKTNFCFRSIFIYFIIIFYAFFSLTNAEIRLCNGRGYRNSTDGSCICIRNFHGVNCEFQYCPFGKSWLGVPVRNNSRNMGYAPCSDMGYCDIITGKCQCRDGFEGMACERMACPTALKQIPITSTLSKAVKINPSTPGQRTGYYVTDPSLAAAGICSGHGICRTMREAAQEFNGLTLIRPPFDYTNWEADKLQGCLCDVGWTGYDCSERQCPLGRDPSDPSTPYDREEVFVLECQATSGFFSILALGYYTQPIPFDADPGYLKFAIEQLPLVGTVEVTMPASSSEGWSPQVCGDAEVVATELRFTDYVGDRPPIFLSLNTSNTRTWPTGSQRLAHSSGNPTLRMATRHFITCQACPDCYGRIYLTYQNSVSSAVNITQTGAQQLLESAVSSLTELVDGQWTNFLINVTLSNGKTSLCDPSAEVVTTLTLYSDYGNIPHLGLLNAAYLSTTTLSQPANITFQSNKGNGTLYECSKQGYCNKYTGECKCFQSIRNGQLQYKATSSNGRGALGLRNDCGYIEQYSSSCFLNGQDLCGGNGYCSNATNTCQCYQGWFGLTCELKMCPEGRAWFDEPYLPNVAHNFSECSSMGSCDHKTGTCSCRKGYTGAACDIRDCERASNTGEACHGHGRCVNIAQYFQSFGFQYGNASSDYLNGGTSTWDAYRWYECLCSGKIIPGAKVDLLHPPFGPNSLVSGRVVGSPPLPGWGNWDCSKRNCPRGNVLSGANNYTGANEIQRIICSLSQSNDSFVLRLYNFQTEKIYTHYDASQIALAISASPVIGNVTVLFPNLDFDNIATACNTSVNVSHGGFLVRFNTELGDLPLLQVSTTLSSSEVAIYEYQPGSSLVAECGGTTKGYCDHQTGTCICNHHQASSNGTNAPGSLGDCSYHYPYPLRSDAINLFGLNRPDF